MNLPKEYLSVSQVRSYQRCPQQYAFKYIDGIPETYGSSLLVGKAFHYAIEAANRAKYELGETMTTDEVKDTFSAAYEGEKATIEFEKDEDPGSLKDRGLEITSKFYENVAQHFNPDYVEQDFDIIVGDVPFRGFIDLTEKDGTIRDFKTTGKTPASDMAETSIQLVAYALAFRDLTGQEETKVVLDYVVNLKKEIKLIHLETKITDQRIERFTNTVQHVAKAISEGVFYANEEGTACSWCSYRKICKG